MIDAEARRRIREDLTATLIVEAAAGTGKTTELVARLVAVLRTGTATLGQIIAVTFTDKAAGEMKLRLRSELEAARRAAASVELARLDGALADLEAARIGTIHAICADLLREWPVEARVDPRFEVAGGDEEHRLFDQAFDSWFQEVLADPPEGVRRLLRRRGRRHGAGRELLPPRRALREAGRRLFAHRDFDAPWRRDPLDREAALDVAVTRLAELAALARNAPPDDFLAQNLGHVHRFLVELGRREAVTGRRDHDGLEAELRDLASLKSWKWRGSAPWFGEGLARDVAIARRDAAKAFVDEILLRCDADLAACLHHELRPLIARAEALKARAGRLDFLDLLVRARDLVRDDARVRAALRARHTHIFVDEFQDTDPLQAELLMLLAGDAPGSLFVVGDPKQSIYRFRRAEPALYESIKQRLVAGGASVLHLSTSFRAVPAIQSAVNASFARAPLGTAYVPLSPIRAEAQGPSVIALPAPRPYAEYGKITGVRIEESYADAVGAFVAELTQRRGVEARHICVLLKRFTSFGEDVTRRYVKALEARRIPHVLVGGRAFHAREEVLAIRNALAAIEWPDDELARFATLRGPFFALTDDSLLAWRLGEPGKTPAEVVEAIAILDALTAERNRRPIADTIARLLEATRAHAGVAIWPNGEQALANILRVIDMARRFEAAGATSFRAFVERLLSDADEGEAADAAVVEEGTDGVRIMTVHRAKGLEFPVVILGDPTAPRAPRLSSRWVDAERRLWVEPLAGCAPVELLERRVEAQARDEEEGVRVAYVAATRAKDLLVVPAVGDDPLWGWLDVLDPAIQPRVRRPPDAGMADTVLDRPGNAMRGPEGAVAPGVHEPREGTHRVEWIDPATLRLGVRADVGVRQQKILEEDEGGVSAEAGVRAHGAWQARRKKILDDGARPSRGVVRTVTELAAAGGGDGDGAYETTRSEYGVRPTGRRFGALVHALLGKIALDASDEVVARAARAEARVLGATRDETVFAAHAVSAALAHPLYRRAAAAAATRRETPIHHVLDDGVLAEGVIDLAFHEPGTGWTVVELKTDGEPEGTRAKHLAQVAIYARAIAAATGEAARGVVLSI